MWKKFLCMISGHTWKYLVSMTIVECQRCGKTAPDRRRKGWQQIDFHQQSRQRRKGEEHEQ